MYRALLAVQYESILSTANPLFNCNNEVILVFEHVCILNARSIQNEFLLKLILCYSMNHLFFQPKSQILLRRKFSCDKMCHFESVHFDPAIKYSQC